ncbi:FadR family transcriptional regulator [Heliobacterium chlorum]|uniref:FadR family transcriptional regulator n=1 Tax=Heliobacterium chlorum TaxID=2698 RepID=A0ABR7SXZ9_HELCL|nr:FadR/GntR family transcriptional regulator [Heliobacterium chlorum]MBC9782910.1 FadR family transcriptional regulator [Heliobacterium chlorum]
MDVRSVQPRRIQHEVVDHIKDLIEERALQPGDKLPSERELAEMFKVSRTAVREASSALQVLGILEVRRGEGTFVSKPRDFGKAEALARILAADHGTERDLQEMRIIVEVAAAALAAKRCGTTELDLINHSIRELRRAVWRNQSGVEADFQFHFTVIMAAQNPYLFRFMDYFSDIIRASIENHWKNNITTRDDCEAVLNAHQAICDAILQGDSVKARQLMHDHLKSPLE